MTNVTPGDIKWKTPKSFVPKDNWLQRLLLVPSRIRLRYEMYKRMRALKKRITKEMYDAQFYSVYGAGGATIKRALANIR